ncbi:MAG: hypothetical protein IPI23_00800 [Bacteroidetes bacterium]|nr:hypothetical protein [Bacteroidota bacterium]
MKSEIKADELNSIYDGVFRDFEQKSISEIYKEIKSIRDISFFKVIFEGKVKSLNKISFVLWTQGEIQKLPAPSNQLDADIWNLEILPILDWPILQQVLTKLLKEQGITKQVEESYKYLINQGWEVNDKEELETIVSFLDNFKSHFPSISLSEDNFVCKNIEYFWELYDKALIQELSDDRTEKYIESLTSDEERARFIEKQPSGKILSYYSSLPTLSSFKDKYIIGTLEKEFSKMEFLCFDLESDGDKIREYAWKNRVGIK